MGKISERFLLQPQLRPPQITIRTSSSPEVLVNQPQTMVCKKCEKVSAQLSPSPTLLTTYWTIRNSRKSRHQTRSHLPRALSKRAPEKWVGGTLCYLVRVLRRRHSDRRLWGGRRIALQYAKFTSSTLHPPRTDLTLFLLSPGE